MKSFEGVACDTGKLPCHVANCGVNSLSHRKGSGTPSFLWKPPEIHVSRARFIYIHLHLYIYIYISTSKVHTYTAYFIEGAALKSIVAMKIANQFAPETGNGTK